MAILTQRSVDALQPRTKWYAVWDDDPHGFGLRIWPSGRKVYVVKYELRGSRKDKWYTLGDHAVLKTQAAREMAKQFLARVRQGNDPVAEIRKARQGKTLADLLTKYLTDVLPHESLSARHNKAIHLRYWQQMLGEVHLDELTPQKIAEARKPLRQGRSDSTVNRYFSSLSAALQVAVQDWGWLPMNPLRQVSRLGEPRGRVRWLEPQDELQRLMRVCAADANPYIYLVVLLELQTGVRKMDLMRMQWSQVSFEASEARLRVHRSKNKRWDTVAVSGEVFIRLQAHHAQRDQTNPWVFPNQAKTGPFDIRRSWERVRREAGLSDFRFHDLRHTFTSYLAMSGASVRELAEALGDNTLEMALRYAHLSEAHTATVVSRMAQKFLEPSTATAARELSQGELAPGER
jgi:integrase